MMKVQKSPGAPPVEVECHQDDTIEELKRKVGLPDVVAYRIIFAGKIMENSQSLAMCNIQEGSTLIVITDYGVV